MPFSPRTHVPLLAACALIATSFAAAPAAQAASVDCSANLTKPVYQVVNPKSQANLLTLSEGEATNAAVKYGFTEDHGTPFEAASGSKGGMVGVHRLYNAKSGDFVWIKDGTEVATAVAKYGYTDQGVYFYAAPSAGDGCVAVNRLMKGSKHRFALDADKAALVADGWKVEGVGFYAAPGTVTPPADDDDEFTIAVMPDTQTWTGTTDPRFAQATSWLVQQKKSQDLKMVLHTGDIVNWGWLAPSQYTVATDAMKNLEDASIPYLTTVGNHDTRAVGHDGIPGSRGYGGSAYVNNPECVERLSVAECKTNLLVRHTEEYNAAFKAADEGDVAGVFEQGKLDNAYSTFTAGGKKWLVLTLEFAPRAVAVDWAKTVVASHPDFNVIVETHYYLTGSGSIGGDNAGYGEKSPQYVYDNLISKYPNIKMVFSGHTGQAAFRTDSPNGNTVASFLQNDVTANKANAVRMVTINTSTGKVSSTIYAPSNGQTYSQYDQSVTLNFNAGS